MKINCPPRFTALLTMAPFSLSSFSYPAAQNYKFWAAGTDVQQSLC